MPGSNNDTLPWTGNVIDPAAQAKEVAERTDADIRWLQAAFARAQARHAKAGVIGLQADMGDPAAVAPGADGLCAHTPFVRKLAELSTPFRKPVLLLNGDSHGYGADRPLADPLGATGKSHGTASTAPRRCRTCCASRFKRPPSTRLRNGCAGRSTRAIRTSSAGTTCPVAGIRWAAASERHGASNGRARRDRRRAGRAPRAASGCRLRVPLPGAATGPVPATRA